MPEPHPKLSLPDAAMISLAWNGPNKGAAGTSQISLACEHLEHKLGVPTTGLDENWVSQFRGTCILPLWSTNLRHPAVT